MAVPADAAGERLDRFVGALDEVGSRAAAERLVGEGKVLVDGEPRAKSHRLEGGEELTVEVPERAPSTLVAEEVPLVLVHSWSISL